METRPGWHIRLRARLRARVRARARWFGFGLHEPEHERGDHRKDPGGLGVHDARDTLCPKPAQRALRSGAPQQCQLDLTACDRRGTRRVFRARRCGEVRSCWAIAARDGPPPKARTSLHRLRMWPERAAPPPMAQRHAPAGAVVRPARRSTVRGACMPPERAPASPTGARTARERHRPEQPRASACCWYVLEGGYTPKIPFSSPRRPRNYAEHAQMLSATTQSHQTPPARASSRGARRCWLDTTPPEGRPERHTTSPTSVFYRAREA